MEERNIFPEAPKIEYKGSKKFFGACYRLLFGIGLGLMSVGTLLIVLYTFFGRSLIG